MSLPTIVTFWHGPLSWLERLSVASFVRQGHRVEVYAYEPVVGLPEGVMVRDAGTILPREALVFYKDHGTPAVFSDRFRLELMRAGRGVWADLDVYCVRPIADPPAYLFGYERDGSVNNAVLLIPAEAPLLADLLEVFERGGKRLVEPHLPPFRRIEVAVRRMLGFTVAPHQMQFGATGPFALTYHIRRHGLEPLVQPRDVFYPLAYEDVPKLMHPGSRLDAVGDRTLAVHIWRSQLTDRGRAAMPPPAPGSALARLCEVEGVQPQD
ncbi:hypothetical protein [Devosia nitrariae]|uniref:Uncharacterized protein n=1 Tax=Devosia nitrariae TaxID=2071872 RepID=A0ABQ5W128_9HYPH|nr:hypothetical protein [Devosia nitrariae]GLQ53380.1 hypothetical protein GCM10010862_06380 [Devosia nitrariae]